MYVYILVLELVSLKFSLSSDPLHSYKKRSLASLDFSNSGPSAKEGKTESFSSNPYAATAIGSGAQVSDLTDEVIGQL